MGLASFSRPAIRVGSPGTGHPLGEVPDSGPEGVEAAVKGAREAAGDWAALSPSARCEALVRWRDAALDDPRLVETLVAESGKPRHEAEGVELLYFCELIRFARSAASRALATETRRPFLFATKRTRLLRRPLGVVGVVGPWNFPLLNNAADAVFPLAAGNAVVLKPSEITPLTSVLLARLWDGCGNPPGVFQVVTGRGETGASLVELADGVLFTGSVVTGRKVAARCGERLVPCVTELGGKSPMVVLAGADLERAARAACWSSFFHSGQACVRTERILVEEAVAPEFERRLTARVLALRQEAPSVDGSEHDLGAVTFQRQVEIVERQVADALARGAKLLAGGRRRSGLAGNWYEPTLLGDATPAMDVVREETFGPLVGVVRVRDVEEAVRLANDSPLGLNATVFGPEGKARAVAARIESGNVIVNDVLVNYFVVEAPLGGQKASGLGVRHGIEGMRQWTRTTAVTTTFRPLAPLSRFLEKHLAFPYDRRVLRLMRRATRILYGTGWRRKVGPIPGRKV